MIIFSIDGGGVGGVGDDGHVHGVCDGGGIFKKCVSPGATDNDKSRFYHQIHRWDHRTLDSSQDILKYRRWQLQD